MRSHMQATLDDLGKGLGPALVAVLITWMGRTAAFNVAVCGWLPCGLMLVVAGAFTERDVDAMNERLARNVEMAALVVPEGSDDEGIAEM